MNFNQIVKEARDLCGKENRSDLVMFDLAVKEFKKQADKVYMLGWENSDFAESSIPNFYDDLRKVLQMVGELQLSGDDGFDKMLWNILTKIMATFREVLVKNFQFNLPVARVISLVNEMIENGFLMEHRGEDGQLYVAINKDICNISIKIVKTPEGPAPEEIRQKWVGLILPALKISGTDFEFEGHKECYSVPMGIGLKALAQVSPEGAAWFVDNEFFNFLFRLDEAVIVS